MQQTGEIILYQPDENVQLEVHLEDETMYHIGASLKDLGKKWFAFSKMNILSSLLLSKI